MTCVQPAVAQIADEKAHISCCPFCATRCMVWFGDKDRTSACEHFETWFPTSNGRVLFRFKRGEHGTT